MRASLVATAALSLAVSAPAGAADDAVLAPAGSLKPGPELIHARMSHTATLLEDGSIIVIGGFSPDEDVTAAERWDPTDEAFGLVGDLADWRLTHTATLLRDGRILVVGGAGEDGLPVAGAEVWDPTSGKFSPAGSLDIPRSGHSATLLPDGRVLIVGGAGDREMVREIESWDPTTSSFETLGSLLHGRSLHSTVPSADGYLLVIGGWGDDPGSVELLGPDGTTVTELAGLEQPRGYHSAIRFDDGRILVVGGQVLRCCPEPRPIAELWDPVQLAFSPAGLPDRRRDTHTASLLPDGRVLVAGGLALEGVTPAPLMVEIWDAASGTFAPAGELSEARAAHTATTVSDGSVILIGGSGDAGVLATTEVWHPSTDSGQDSL